MAKLLTVGALITDGKKFLIVHPTGSEDNRWDIPKGIKEDTEDIWKACIREVQEETGLDISYKKSKNCGRFYYNQHKDLYLYLIMYDTLPYIQNFTCTSYVTYFDYPEVDKYKYIEFKDMNKYLIEKLKNIIVDIRKNHISFLDKIL